MSGDRHQAPPQEPLAHEELLEEDAARAETDRWSSWGNLWQVPAIVVSLMLIGLGIYLASHRRPGNDFDGVLDQINHLIVVGDFDEARAQLEGVVEPNLELATSVQRARYHATIADWVAGAQEARGVSVPSNNRVIADSYGRAAEMGALLTPHQLERWAAAHIDLGEPEEARKRISTLEALGVTDATGEDARARRNRLLRRLVESTLRQEDLSYESMLAVLESYRDDPMLGPSDLAWVIAHEARLHLEAGEAAVAVDGLLVSMRRLEHEHADLEPRIWGDFYTLLGRGNHDLGRYDHAEYYLDEALERLPSFDRHRSEALLVLGRIELARGDTDLAFDHFDAIVRDFIDTPAHLSAQLARAEVESIRGNHAASIEGYRAVIDRLAEGVQRRDVTRPIVGASLADRHDAAITMGELDLALDYVGVAESLYADAPLPADVLRRIAATSRQIADNMTAAAEAALGDRPARLDLIDPAVRRRMSENYERAGEYFLRHAREMASQNDVDETWAESLWLSADSFDRAGLRPAAIKNLLEYIAGRPIDDPLRPEVTFRLAQAYQAEEMFEEAARYYAQVIDEHPRGPSGTRSRVPLARCYLALGRPRDAEQVLVQVVDGRQGDNPLTPDARDYRAALIELGKLYYDTDDTKRAIERLTAAVTRCQDDPRLNEIRYFLADSHRRHARKIADMLRDEPRMSPRDRLAQEQQQREHLETALDLFTNVYDGYEDVHASSLNRLQRDYRRHAAMYRGDCAFHLGDYPAAEKAYDKAARQYSSHHSSMHALVQIVNCLDHLGRTRDAEIAHHNAVTRLHQLPDEAFDDPNALMDRAAWEQWLKSRPAGLASGSSPIAEN